MYGYRWEKIGVSHHWDLQGLKVANKIYNIIHQEHILLKNDSLESHIGIDFTCCKTNQATESV